MNREVIIDAILTRFMREAAADAFMNSLLPVEDSSSDSSDSSNPYEEITRYYELTTCQKYDETIALHFELQTILVLGNGTESPGRV
jgi:hypothetical protein